MVKIEIEINLDNFDTSTDFDAFCLDIIILAERWGGKATINIVNPIPKGCP